MPVPPPARGAYARYSPQPQALAAGPQAAATVLQALAAVPPGLGGMNPPMAMSSQAYPFSLLAPRYGGGSIHPPRMSPMLSQVNGAPPRQGNSMGRSSTSNVAARTTSSSSSLFNYAAPESSNFAARTSSSSAAYALPQQQLQSSAMSMPMGHSGTSDDLMSLSSSPWADMEVSFASAAPSLPAYDSELLLSTPFDPTICEVDNFSADEFALLDSGDDYCVSVPPPPQTKNPRIAFNPPEPDFGGAFGGPWAAGTLQQATNISAPDSLEALARLQSFDGSFTLGVLSVIALRTDLQTVRDALPAAAPDQVVATVLAMSFLAAKLAAEHEAWAGLHEKARQYIAVALRDMGAAESVTADMLQARVGAMLA
ncbi:hypothetical protein FB451DRAFT_406080 [Mycena latifolia]|nr:hypothetical protein FB451DRAFT_406080 [Mycena latifolia]